MLTKLEQIYERVRQSKQTGTLAVVWPKEETLLTAVKMAREEGTVLPVLYGEQGQTEAALKKIGEDAASWQIMHAESEEEAARKAVADVRENRAQILLKGNLHTSVLLKAVLNKESGIRKSRVLFNVNIVELPGYHKLLVLTDGAVLVQPTLEQKADMIKTAAEVMHRMGFDEVKCAVLAATDEVSDKQPETLDAAELKKMYLDGAFPSYCKVDGPLAFDLCVDEHAVRAKGIESEVAADADLIVAHHIVVINTLNKALRKFAGADSPGFIIGAQAPIIVTSRGAPLDSKYSSILVAAAAAL